MPEDWVDVFIDDEPSKSGLRGISHYDKNGKSITRVAQEARIVGGDLAIRGQFPWFVSLYISINEQLRWAGCGATLIGKEWILTAGHCRIVK
eukprot:3026227-Ditylum_brightwellii.AAC.1